MDDYKRGLYLDAQRRLMAGTSTYVCTALDSALERDGFISEKFQQEIIEEIFPEFFALFDGMYYCSFEEETYRGSASLFIGKGDMWWPSDYPEPRLRMIHFLLENR